MVNRWQMSIRKYSIYCEDESLDRKFYIFDRFGTWHPSQKTIFHTILFQFSNLYAGFSFLFFFLFVFLGDLNQSSETGINENFQMKWRTKKNGKNSVETDLRKYRFYRSNNFDKKKRRKKGSSVYIAYTCMVKQVLHVNLSFNGVCAVAFFSLFDSLPSISIVSSP